MMWKISIFYLFLLFLSISAEPSYDLERIVNSTETTIKEYPFIVSIQWFKYHICGGVIISEEFIITSARCIATFPPSELKILAGSTERNNYVPPAQEVQFTKAIVHNGYDPKTWANDIAILVLIPPLDLSGDNAKSIGFYEGVNPIPSSEYLTGIGWGVLEEGASFYPINLHAKPMFSNSTDYCMELLEPFNRVIDPESMFCVIMDESDLGGTCDGDWGGPLVTTITEQNPDMKLVGLASWGFKCNEEYPHIFTNLQWMQEFIYSNTGLWPLYNIK